MQAVVAALELQDFFAGRSGASNATGVHGDFRAARAETHHFDGIALTNLFGKFPFLVVRHAEGRAAMEFDFDGFDDGGMTMPSHERAETQVVVDVFVAVEVMNPAAFSVFH